MSYIQQAFDIVCNEAKQPEQWYVILVSSYQAYGGPEEGGWTYDVSTLEAFQCFQTQELAEAAAEAIKALAKDLESDARRQHGEYCLQTMEWLEQRGLDADFLPEPDGPTTYRVAVVDALPTFDNHRPQYC